MGTRVLSRTKRVLTLAMVVFLAVLATFALAEVGVRIRHRLKFGDLWGIEQTYTVDRVSGLRIPVPGGSFGGIRINSLGFRGPELVVPKPPNTVRLAFLGSSTTFCAEVSSNENTWPHLVTEALRTRWPGVLIDYVNGGVPGYSVNHSLRNLDQRIAPLAPDVIVIYEGHNDLSGNSFALAVDKGLASRRTEQGLSWPSKYSLLWYLLEKNLLVLTQRRSATETVGKLEFGREEIVAPFRTDLQTLVRRAQDV